MVIDSLETNSYRLHDMVDDVWRYCVDWYGKDYYSLSSVKFRQMTSVIGKVLAQIFHYPYSLTQLPELVI